MHTLETDTHKSLAARLKGQACAPEIPAGVQLASVKKHFASHSTRRRYAVAQFSCRIIREQHAEVSASKAENYCAMRARAAVIRPGWAAA
jgi:hypothetical protein